VLPGRSRYQAVVHETVSLRDVAATITELVGMRTGSPFPGQSLARLWRGLPQGVPSDSPAGALSELTASNPASTNQGRSPAAIGPLVALAAGDFVYIRNEGDGREELFDERDDPRELTNRARVAAMQPVLQRFRSLLQEMRALSPGGGLVKRRPRATVPGAVAARAP
jgi:hypothetical protein